jgi:exodeoxyribonuclease VII large subunit
VKRILGRAGERLGALVHTLEALSPLGVLERGYAVCRRPGGAVVRSAAEVDLGAPVEILLHEGSLLARVTAVEKSRRRAGG